MNARKDERMKLVRYLEAQGIIKSKSVRDAIASVPRELFVWEGYEDEAYQDTPLPLGNTGQTISAPHMVALMLEELDLRAGNIVLEVGSGSGYNAACISRIVGDSGRVVSIEIEPMLVSFSSRNIGRLGIKNVEIHQGDGSLGWPPNKKVELYDRIVITAAAPSIPQVLIAQLKKDGILLAPLGRSAIQVLTKLTKDSMGKIYTKSICECMFVPLITDGQKVI